MSSLAEVYILDVPYHADKAYTYYVPVTAEDSVERGSVVEVPFGKGNRRVAGIVTDIVSGEPDGTSTTEPRSTESSAVTGT